jgi:hypothetical protein
MIVASAVDGFLVTPMWVARHYNVSNHTVYRAIRAGKLSAVKVQGAPDKKGRPTFTYALDVRLLPSSL